MVCFAISANAQSVSIPGTSQYLSVKNIDTRYANIVSSTVGVSIAITVKNPSNKKVHYVLTPKGCVNVSCSPQYATVSSNNESTIRIYADDQKKTLSVSYFELRIEGVE